MHLVRLEAEWMQLEDVFVGDHRDRTGNVETGESTPRDLDL